MSDIHTFSVVALPGDGVGPEVMPVALDILEITQRLLPVRFEVETIDCGGRYYLTHGTEWPDGAADRCRQAHAILLGAVGHAHGGSPVFTRPGQPYDQPKLAGYAAVIGNRKNLNLFANVRPVKWLAGTNTRFSGRWTHLDSPFDYLIVRENTEDAYVEKSSRHGAAVTSQMEITADATRRIARFAFDLANRRNDKRTVTCVDKSNMIAAHAFFREQVTALAKAEYPDVTLEYAYVDAFCLSQLQTPERYDVVLCPNLVGDIVSDAAAILLGGLGMAPSANLGTDHAMFEPVHGSAPDIAGRDLANPMGMVLSVGMMFDWLHDRYDCPCLAPLSGIIREAVAACCQDRVVTRDISRADRYHACGTVGEAICHLYRAGVLQKAMA